jgi:hypothetical protein
MRAGLVLAISLLLCGQAYSQMTSVYTSTRAEACRTIKSSTEGTGSYVGECRGPRRYKVEVLEGDLRQSLNVITPNRKKNELNFWGFYGGFSSIGDKIEWRMKAQTPVALVARYAVADPEDSQKTTSYLMVAKVTTAGSCVTDIAMPGPKRTRPLQSRANRSLNKVSLPYYRPTC